MGSRLLRTLARAAGVLLIHTLVGGATLVLADQPQSAESNELFAPIINAAQPKMVKVFGAGAGRVEAYATGILVSAEGHILTTAGSMLDGAGVRVLTSDGVTHFATILKRDRIRQLALLKIQLATPDYFRLASEPVGQKGDWVIALSNAFRVADKDEPLSAMLGIISLRTFLEAKLNSRDVAYRGDLVVIDAVTSNPGAGGGAIVTLSGELVGMIGKIINSSETNTRLNYAVPASLLKAFMDGDAMDDDDQQNALAENRVRGYSGIRIFTLGGKRDPAYIDRVASGSPAAIAGLQADDLVVSINGQKVGSVRTYQQLVRELFAGDTVVVVVKRGNDLLSKSMVLVERQSGE